MDRREKTLLRNKTGSWQPVTPPYAPTTRSYLHAIDPSHLWVFHAGIAQFWNGTKLVNCRSGQWRGAASGQQCQRRKREDAVYACIPQETYPAAALDGINFIRVNLPDPVRVLALNECAVEAVSGSDVWLFGDAGIGHFDGTTWTVSESSRQRAVRSVSNSGSTGIAVGNNGRY